MGSYFRSDINVAGLPRCLSGNESACNAGDLDLIPRSGRNSWKEMTTHSSISLGNPMDRGARQAKAHGVTEGVRHDLATKQKQQHKGRKKDTYQNNNYFKISGGLS